MTKLKKQVSKKKLLQFFKTNRCVVFFHYDGDTKMYFNFIQQKLCSQFQVTSLFVKNKIADISLTELLALHNLDSNNLTQKCNETQQKIDLFLQKLDRDKITNLTTINQKQNKEGVRENKMSPKNVFFQGPTIFLGFKDLQNMQNVYNLCKNEKFILCIAAFYDNTFLNHSQIERLANLSSDPFLYSKFLKTSRQPLNQLVNVSRNCFNLHSLNFFKMQAMYLLKIRMLQLAEKKGGLPI